LKGGQDSNLAFYFMKQYPSITKNIRKDLYIYAFDKLDGSNIRAGWNSKKGFYKFGSRTELIDKSSPFGGAISLIQDKYSQDLSRVFKDLKWSEAVCFFEYFGPSSFAGSHNFKEDMDTVLIDISPFKIGILPPARFIEYFGHLNTAKVLYEGDITSDLFDTVKQSTMQGMTSEGVVCKGMDDKHLIMFKIKSNAWLDKLKIHCNGNDFLYQKLE
jgi:hypothetical protein